MDGTPDEDGVSRSSEDSKNMGRNVNKNQIQQNRLRQKNVMQHIG